MSQFDGMAEMLRKATESAPDLKDKLEQAMSDPFLEAYPLALPDIMGLVDEELDPASKDFFILYTKLLKAYASGQDSRFVMDFFCFGADNYEMFVNRTNKPHITKGLLLRGSQLRAVSEQMPDVDPESFLKIYSKTIEVWALSDTLELKYGSFLPVKISNLIAQLQTEASK